MQSFFRTKKTEDDKQEIVEEALLANYDSYYRLAYAYVKNPEDAGDIVQEGAYQAIKKCRTLEKPEYVKTWLYRLMLNEVFSFCRKKQKTVSTEEVVTEPWTEDRYQDMDLWKALDALEDKDRTVILLRYFEEYKISEIADIMDEKVSTIKRRLYRGIKKMRIQMENDWIWEE